MFSENEYVIQKVEKLFNVEGFVSSYYFERSKDFYYSGEMHDFWEAVYIAEGKITATADERVYILEKGDILFHRPMEFHRLRAVEGFGSHLYIFTFDASGDRMKFFEQKLFSPNEEIRILIEKTAKKIKSFLECRENSEYPFLSHAASASTESLLLALYCTSEKTSSPVMSEQSENYRDIVRILNENIDKELSLNQIAEMCNMSVSNLKKKFALYSDGGVKKYFMHIKIRKAISLLYQGISIPKISDALNFSNVSYFYSVFKRETGCTPKEYIKKHR